MSDLQCAATFLVVAPGDERRADLASPDNGGALSDQGRRQVHQLVGQVRTRRIAAVYSSRGRPALESAELAATELGLALVVVDGLQELSADDLALGSPDAGRLFTEAIEAIADVHRGETVLVFTHVAVMSLALPKAWVDAGNGSASGPLPDCALAQVEVDADGWRLVSWPGTDRLSR